MAIYPAAVFDRVQFDGLRESLPENLFGALLDAFNAACPVHLDLIARAAAVGDLSGLSRAAVSAQT